MAVTPSGKDKLLLYTRLYIGAYSLCDHGITFNECMAEIETPPIDGWCQNAYYISSGKWTTGISGVQLLMDDDADSTLDRLKTVRTAVSVALLFGGGGAPAVGDPCYGIPSIQPNTITNLPDGRVAIQADFLPAGDDRDAYLITPFGVVLSPETSLSSTTTQNSVDLGQAHAAGAWGMILVTASSGGTWSFIIQDSANDTDWASYLPFTITGDTIETEVVTQSSACDRYVRAVCTRTSGTVTPVILFFANPVDVTP